MSKRSSVESPNHQSSSTPIKPALQAVLGSLDVNLEAELTTYRRHRRRAEQWVSPSVRTGKQTATTEQQLAQNLAPETAEETQQPLSLPLSLAGTQGDAPLATTRGGTKLSSSALAPNNYLESSEKLIESLDESKAEPTVERSLAASLLTPLGLSSMLLFLLSCTALGYAVMYPSNLVKMAGLNRLLDRNAPSSSDSPASTSPSDTSTKELPKAPNLVSKEFVELDLSTLSNVQPTVSPIPSPSPKASIPPTPPAPPGPSGVVPIPTEDGNPPRGREQGLNNLSTALLPSPSPSAAQPVPTLPTLPPTPSPAQPTATSPAAASPAAASPAAASPAAASPAAASPLGRPTRAADGFYYVVTDYTDEKSLQQARTAVPDAYVRNFSKGVKIQMGALNDPASAERLVKELQEKGVKPQYYQP
ncbi:SPOR domain-containing protein [Microcoleus vaginatus]|uniref:SPOR domain-containing protein n=1 Tax=Microcoleus vaginatus TaxID=119532 RepID=UPI001F603CD9